MPITIPADSVYYYEVTARSTRLFLWMPRAYLELIVSKNNVAKEILEDYPDGIDIEISEVTFEELSERYNFEIGVNPHLIWQAFDAVWLKIGTKHLPCSGYIERRFLERLVSEIKRDTAEKKPIWQQEKRTDGKSGLKMRNQWIRRMRAYLKEFPVKDLDRQKPFDKQAFSHVKMGPGEEPLTFFHRIQTRKRGKK